MATHIDLADNRTVGMYRAQIAHLSDNINGKFYTIHIPNLNLRGSK